MNREIVMLEQSGRVVDVEKLATNFIDIISDCAGLEDFSLRNALQDMYPLAAWLMDTSFARLLRQRSTNPQLFHKSTEEGVVWEMGVPGTVRVSFGLYNDKEDVDAFIEALQRAQRMLT